MLRQALGRHCWAGHEPASEAQGILLVSLRSCTFERLVMHPAVCSQGRRAGARDWAAALRREDGAQAWACPQNRQSAPLMLHHALRLLHCMLLFFH